MKRSTRRLIALGLVAALLLACGGGSRTNAPSAVDAKNTALPGERLNAEGTPQKGGTLSIAMASDPGCLDPHAYSTDAGQMLGHIQFDHLVWLGRDGTPKPHLAASWTISPDGKVYTFKLRPGVTFADGAPFNAAAVVANFEHMLDPKTRSPLAGPYIQPYDRGRVVDDLTVEVTLKTAYSPFLSVLAQGWLGMQSPKALKEKTPAQNCSLPVGSGPFVLKSYTPNVGASYVRREGYSWAPPELGESGPHLDAIEVAWIGQDPVRHNALISGQYHVTQYVPPQDFGALKANPGFITQAINRIGWPWSFEFNTSRPPMNDVNLRKAIVTGIDVDAIVRTSQFGHRAAAKSFLSTVTQHYDETARLPTTDIAAANAMLDQAGWATRNAAGIRTKDGKPLALTTIISNATTINPIFDLLQAQLKGDLGIELVYRLLPPAQATTERFAGNYDILGGYWHTTTPDILFVKFHSSQIPDATRLGQNLAKLNDPTLDGLLQQARETVDPAKLRTIYAEAQHRLTDVLVPGLPIYQASVLWAFNKRLHNVYVNTAHGGPYVAYSWLSN